MRPVFPLRLWFLVVGMWPFLVSAAAPVPVRLNVDINVDGRYQPSTIQLVVPLKRAALLGAAAAELDNDDRAMAEFLIAMTRGNRQQLLPLWEQDPEDPNTLDVYLAGMRTFADVGMLGRISTAQGELMLFRASSGGKTIVRAFTVRHSSDKTLRFGSVNLTARPVEAFLVNCFAAIVDVPSLEAHIASGAPPTRGGSKLLRLDVNGPGIRLEFSGRRLAGTVPGAETTQSPAARVVSRRMQSLASGRDDDLRKVLSADAQSSFEAWRKTMTTDQFRAYAAAQVAPRQAVLEIDAGTVRLVFYRNAGEVAAHGTGPLSYEYVVLKEGGGVVVNVLRDGLLDDFLRSGDVGQRLAAVQ